MDVKAPKKKYPQLTGVKSDLTRIEASIDLLKTKAPAYEFKTTFIPGLLFKEDIVEIAEWLKGRRYISFSSSRVNLLWCLHHLRRRCRITWNISGRR